MGPNFIGSRKFSQKANDNSYYVANNYSPSPATTEPKSKTKLLIIIAIAAVVLISLFALIGSVRKQKQEEQQKKETTFEEATDLIDNIELNYEILLDLYGRRIGFTPNLEYTERSFFPSGDFSSIKTQRDLILSEIDEINKYDIKALSQTPERTAQKLEELTEKLKTNISSLSPNIDTMVQFYDAFYRPAFESENHPEDCTETDEMKALISSNKNYISLSATKYKAAFCALVPFLSDGMFTYDEKESFYADNGSLIENAVNILNRALESKNEEELKIDDWDVFEIDKENQ